MSGDSCKTQSKNGWTKEKRGGKKEAGRDAAWGVSGKSNVAGTLGQGREPKTIDQSRKIWGRVKHTEQKGTGASRRLFKDAEKRGRLGRKSPNPIRRGMKKDPRSPKAKRLARHNIQNADIHWAY